MGRRTVYNQARTFKAIVNEKTHAVPIKQRQFPLNFIKTSKYNVANFLPKALLLQFSRYANIYFLIIAILQVIPIISPLSPWSAIIPLLFVLGVSMIREAAQDISRHKSDNFLNATKCTVIKDGKKVESSWALLQVGDLVFVPQDQAFPADLLVLTSSLSNGACYIETGALDGEKNLKPKGALSETQDLLSLEKYNPNLNISVFAESPNQDLYRFEGSISIDEKKIAAGSQQMLLRGAFLRNTDWIIGVVVYSGLDTQIMRNAEASRNKQSNMEMKMNYYILAILGVQLFACLISAIFTYAWGDAHCPNQKCSHWYLELTINQWENAVIQFFSYFILYNTMIPISLIVSMEMVKVAQSYFISNDAQLYHQGRDFPAQVSTTTINEELGQIEYIFSDKTGTLTCNVMVFKMCIIGEKLYGDQPQSETKKPQQKSGGGGKHSLTVFEFQDPRLNNLLLRGENDFPVNLKLESVDKTVNYDIKNQKDLAFEYFTLLGGAHECIVQRIDKNKPLQLSNIKYQGPSPDEITLVDAAMNMGFAFVGASASTVDMKIQNQDQTLQLIHAFQFDSARKRMSVIVKHKGVYQMLIKGADNIITKRLSKNRDQPFYENIKNLLLEFSQIGLRTLMMAMKVMSEKQVNEFQERQTQLADSPNREAEMNKLADEIETELFLLGATAVEDKLQDRVPQVIADFIRANIQVWMLTGDKLETAQNIAKSCRLIQDDMELLVIKQKEIDKLRQEIFDVEKKFLEYKDQQLRKALLIEGEALAVIFPERDLKEKYVEISKDCQSVVCCRVTPKQKAEVVRSIKDTLNQTCVAIGDGANDVNMIQEAQIGVGIFGNQGMRAVQASDFAFVEFKGLWKLLFFHGRYSYIRNGQMVLYFFFKNMMFTVPQFLFAFFSALSGQSFFDDFYVTTYNLIFTALPLIAQAIFDQDVNYNFVSLDQNVKTIDSSEAEKIKLNQEKQINYIRKKLPLLYDVGQTNQIFNQFNFILYCFIGVVYGVIIFFMVLFLFDLQTLQQQGTTAGFWDFSLTVYTIIIWFADIRIAFQTRYWTWINFFSLFFTSIVLYYIFFIVTHYVELSYVYMFPLELMKTSYHWLILALLCFMLLMGESMINFFTIDFEKSLPVQLQQFQHLNDYNINQEQLEELNLDALYSFNQPPSDQNQKQTESVGTS